MAVFHFTDLFFLLDFHWTNLLQPQWYIEHGGLWLIMFIIFAETGLLAGFFLPGDSLLFVTGILSGDLVANGLKLNLGSPFLNLLLLGALIAAAGIIGNFVGYWFGNRAGPFLFERKDTFLFKKKYLLQARDFYEKHGGGAIVFARFVPILRTFAPVVAGIVQMDKKKFTFFNIIGSIAWVYTMLFAGYYLQELFITQFDFDLKEHLEIIVLVIVFLTTAPVLIKLFSKKKGEPINELPEETIL